MSQRGIVAAVVLLLFAIYVAKLVRSRSQRAPSRAIVVLDENRWLCEQLLHVGFTECHSIPSRTPGQHLEVLTSADVDTGLALASATFFVIGAANDALLRLEATAAQADDWGRTELQPLLDALARLFAVEPHRTVLFAGAPPRSLVGSPFDLSNVPAVLERAAKPRLAVLPTWCVFERVVRERNATSHVFMPDNWNLNHHGAFIVAKMIADRFLEPPSLANVTLPDNMDAETAQFLWQVADDCYAQDQAKSATTPA